MRMLIQSTGYSRNTELMILAGVARGHEMTYATHADFSILGSGQNVQCYCGNVLLTSDFFDVIYLRNTLFDQEFYKLIARFAHNNDVFVVDYDGIMSYGEKIFNMSYVVKSADFSIIPTASSLGEVDANFLNNLDYPLIHKPSFGGGGEGVMMISSRQDLSSHIKQHGSNGLFQSYIPNSGDIRVVVIGDFFIPIGMKRVASDDDFRNNVSLGGHGEIYNFSSSLREKIQHFISYSGVCYDIYGLDLIEDPDSPDEYYIMEFDRSIEFSGFTEFTGYDVAGAIVDFLADR